MAHQSEPVNTCWYQLLHVLPPVVCQQSPVLLLNLNLIKTLNKFRNEPNWELMEWVPAGLSGRARREDKAESDGGSQILLSKQLYSLQWNQKASFTGRPELLLAGNVSLRPAAGVLCVGDFCGVLRIRLVHEKQEEKKRLREYFYLGQVKTGDSGWKWACSVWVRRRVTSSPAQLLSPSLLSNYGKPVFLVRD